MSLMDDIAGVSASTKAVGVMALGAAVAIGGKLAGGGVAVAVVGGGLIGLGLILVALAQGMQFVERRRSASFGKGLQRDVSEKFRAGWQRLAKAGKDKDPYFLPWYIMVGEPGAGKTQAIKHSNIKFVPGFNDPATGEGGTLAMDWWFADKAILLDTAGALLMDTARTEEFQEFLLRIRQHRPALPINGLILAIPANMLQTDSQSEIQAKSTVIAQQLDLVQRELGVRFPVYVIITKADLISGFREFFDNISDPAIAAQILGWSNPAGLDAPFDPGEVEAHLDSVAAALRRRRLGLLLDPIGEDTGTKDSTQKRIDKTDALYAFPDQLAQVGLRLRTYLENVFMPSEWTQAPLFLRGIYFTSSMREGPPLDLDLARSFNISPKDLPAEVRVWEREKACFLRDLFVEKIFRERGLVTASMQVEKRVKTRHSIVLGVGLTALAAVVAFTIFGYLQLKQSVGGEYDFWSAVTHTDPNSGAAAALDWASQPPDTRLDSLGIHFDDASTLGDIAAANVTLAQQDIRTPWIFYFAQAFGGDINAGHVAAHKFLFDRGVERGAWSWLLQQRASGKGGLPVWPWETPAASRQGNPVAWADADAAGGRVLGQLILMDLGGASRQPSDQAPPAELARFKDILDAAGWPDDSSSVQSFRDAWLWFQVHSASPDKTLSTKWAGVCVNRLIDYYNTAMTQALQARSDLLSAAADFDAKEQAFNQVLAGANDADSLQPAWTGAQAAAVIDAGKKLTDGLQSMAVIPGEVGNSATFAHMYEAGSATAGVSAINDLLSIISSSPGAADLVQSLQSASDALKKRASDAASAAQPQLAQLSSWSANAMNQPQSWPFAQRLAGYQSGSKAWSAISVPVKTDNLSQEISAVAALAYAPDASPVLKKALAAAASKRATVVWDAVLSADQAVLAKALADAGGGTPLQMPDIPFAHISHPPTTAFDPPSAAKLLARFATEQKLWASQTIQPLEQARLKQLLDKNQSALHEYIAAYEAAWEAALKFRVAIAPSFDPKDLEGASDQLKQLGDQVAAAMAVLPPDASVQAVLDSVKAGEAAPANLESRGARLLEDWKLIIAGAPRDDNWQHDLHLFDDSTGNFVADYWKRLGECVAACTNMMDQNPAMQVSVANPSDPAAPPGVAAASDQLRKTFGAIQFGTSPAVPVTSNSPQDMKLQDGLDVTLQFANNTTTDTAGSASRLDVITRLMDFRSVQSSADASVWYVYLESDQKKCPIWLKLKFMGEAPKLPG